MASALMMRRLLWRDAVERLVAEESKPPPPVVPVKPEEKPEPKA